MNTSDKVLYSLRFSNRSIKYWLIFYAQKEGFSVLFKTIAF